MMDRIPKTILVVDDDRDSRMVCLEVLNHEGFRVLEAEHGEAAMSAVRTSPPDLVLMDLALPRVDGWTLTTLLKGDERTRNIPIVVLTANVFQEHRERAEKAGCDSFLEKPCPPRMLLREVRRILGTKGSPRSNRA